MLTGILGGLLDVAAPVRRLPIDRVITEGHKLDRLMADEDALEVYVRANATGIWHASGTCRMGAAEDPDAVVDAKGRVHGIGKLRVIDASVMPSIPCANTNLPVIMFAEKLADAILQG